MKRLVFGAALLFCARSVHADEPVTTVYAANACKSASWAQGPFLELLRVELATEHVKVESTGTPPDDAAQLTALPDACTERATGATLTFTRGTDHKERHVDLTTVAPNAKARVLALAAAELLRNALTPPVPVPVPVPDPVARIDLHITIDPAPAPAPTPRPQPPPPPAAIASAPFVSFVGEARTFPRGATGLFGGRVALSVPLHPMVALTFDLGGGYGGAQDPLGDISSVLVGGSVGVALVAGPRTVRFLVGPRIEVDWAHFQGIAYAPTTFESSADSAAALAILSATTHVAVDGHLWATLGLDAGLSLYGYGARADARHVADVLGPTLGIRLGLAWGARVE